MRRQIPPNPPFLEDVVSNPRLVHIMNEKKKLILSAVGFSIIAGTGVFVSKVLPRSEPVQVVKAQKKKEWWVADSSFTDCIKTGGPAEQLDQYVGMTDRPFTRDRRGANGELLKVEVINPIGGGREEVTTYFSSKDRCMSEKVNANQVLADQYR